MFNSNFEKRGEHINTNESEQIRPSIKELWASNPSNSLHSLEPSYNDFRGPISFQSHSFKPPNNSAWVSNNFDHTQEWPTTSNAWTPPILISFNPWSRLHHLIGTLIHHILIQIKVMIIPTHIIFLMINGLKILHTNLFVMSPTIISGKPIPTPWTLRPLS